MDSPEKTAGSRRRKVLLTAGISAALAVSALALPSAANAVTATLPTVSLTAPAQIVNSDPAAFDPSQVYTLTVDNSATGTAKLTGDLLAFGIDLPSGLACSAITLEAVSSAPPISLAPFKGDNSNCTGSADLPTLNAGKSVSYKYNVEIDGLLGSGSNATLVTGTVPSTFELATSGGTPVVPAVTASSNLVNGTAPTLTAPGAAIVHQAYSAQVVTIGYPTPTSLTVYQKHVSNKGVVSYGPPICGPATTGSCDLNDGLVLDLAKGSISGTPSASVLNSTDINQPTYVIVANNGQGGAPAKDTTTPITTLKHDVAVTVSIPVLFSDVPTNSTFALPIYTLAGTGVGGGVINGFADGTFRPTVTVNREQFAQITAEAYENAAGNPASFGQCTGASVSAFTDVPKTSPFCAAIKFLSGLGVINGETATTFGGGDLVTRGQISALVSRADESLHGSGPTELVDRACPAGGSGFSDVPKSSVFCGDIAWMATNKITTGFADGTFQPSRGAARQEAAAFLFRFETLEGVFA